jgi:hypothetical protein
MKRRASILIVTALASAALLGAATFSRQSRTHLGGRPSALVRLTANLNPGSNSPLDQIGPDGNSLGPLTLPQKTVLIVTDLLVSVNGTPVAGITRGGLINQSLAGSVDPYYSFDATNGSQSIHLTSGVRWSEVPLAINADDSKSAVFIAVYGYLAADK